MDYPFNFTAVIDLLCIVPIIFKFSLLREWLADLLYGQLFTGLYCLRIIRTKRLVTVGRIYTKFLADEVNASIAEFGINFISLVLIASGLFYTIEQELYPILSDLQRPRFATGDSTTKLHFHDCVYFIIVTTSTVGFGDISPSTQLGRMVVSFIIGIGLVIIPMSVRNILDLISQRSLYRTTYLPDADVNMRHIIFAGTHYNDAPILERFMRELYHPDRTNSFDVDRTVLIVGPCDPDESVKQLLESALLRSKARFVRGTLMQEEDLIRFAADDAKACFILVHKQAKDVRKEDDAALIRALVVSNFCHDIRIFMQILDPSRKEEMEDEEGVDTMQCVDQLKMELLAAACNCLAINTLLDNMVTCLDDGNDSSAEVMVPWQREYIAGTEREVYEVLLTDEIVGIVEVDDPAKRSTILMGGMSWGELLILVAEVTHGLCTLIGIVIDGMMCLHPGMGFAVPHRSGLVLVIIADDKNAAEQLLNPKIYRRHFADSIQREVHCAPMRPFLPNVPGHDYEWDQKLSTPGAASSKSDTTTTTSKDKAHHRKLSGGSLWRRTSHKVGKGIVMKHRMEEAFAPRPHSSSLDDPDLLARAAIAKRVDDAAAADNSFGAPRAGYGLTEVDDARSFNLRGHIVVTGSMQNVTELVHKLRLTEMNGTIYHKPVLLLVPLWEELDPEDAAKEMEVLDDLRSTMMKYRDMFLIRGDPSSHVDLERAALESAACCLLLADRRDLIVIDGDSLSVRTIFTYLSIEQYVQGRLGEGKMRDFYVVVDLGSKSTMRILNSKVLGRERENDADFEAVLGAPVGEGVKMKDVAEMLLKRTGNRKRGDVGGAHLIEFFAAGYGLSSDMFDSLLTQCYFCRSLIATFEQMVGHGYSVSSPRAGFHVDHLEEKRAVAGRKALIDNAKKMEDVFGVGAYQLTRPLQVAIPPEFHRVQWGVLYHHLVSVENVVPLGLYRCEHAAGPMTPADLPYVFTCPSLDTLVNEDDKAIVLIRLDNPMLSRTAVPLLNVPPVKQRSNSQSKASQSAAEKANHALPSMAGSGAEPSKEGGSDPWAESV